MKFDGGPIILTQDKRFILFQGKNNNQRLSTKISYISSLKTNIINFGPMIEEGNWIGYFSFDWLLLLWSLLHFLSLSLTLLMAGYYFIFSFRSIWIEFL